MRYRSVNPRKDTITYDREMCLSKVEWENNKANLYEERAKKASHFCKSVQGPNAFYSVEQQAALAHRTAERLWERAAYDIDRSWVEEKVKRKLIRDAEKASENGRQADLNYHACMAESEADKARRAQRSNPDNPVAFERTTVQTLLFPKDAFTVASARAWAKQHNFRASKVDTGSARATRLRVRQREPSVFQKGSFRTILLDHARGVEAVIGAPLRRNPEMRQGSSWKRVTDYKGNTTWSRIVWGQSAEIQLPAGSKTYGLYVNGRFVGTEPKHEQGLAWAKQAVTEYAKDRRKK